MSSMQEIQNAQCELEIFLENIKEETAKWTTNKKTCISWRRYSRFERAYQNFRILWEAWGDAFEFKVYRKAIDRFNNTLFEAENYLFQLRLKTAYRIG